ncbi:LysE family translocator [Trichlorobacter sp.]|uniref:LysE family translocator n=1 Tax=Trichlorobacter sp. TaxID=2911007 RepID=UPI002A35CD81|nr:LysE family translocator [Trichlorobacter sp.]MDY0385097.1 LysE family translocator [Trichlorobacter sp.]
MPATETLLAFFLASLVLAVAPGPDNLFVLTQAALRGRSAGLAVTLGLCTGLLVHTTAVALGLAALFAASALAFTLLKLCGAGYLLWLAWQAWRASSTSIRTAPEDQLSGWQLYRRGILMNITNPKVSVFFLAFLPQFADPARGPLTQQLLLLGAIFMVATILVFGGIALLAGMLGAWLTRSPGLQRIMNRLTATVFVGLALKLALSER